MESKGLFLNHQEDRCGVYQYGKSVWKILVAGEDWDILPIEAQEKETFDSAVANWGEWTDYIVVNWHPSTLPWFTPELSRSLKMKKIFILHEGRIPEEYGADIYLTSDMSAGDYFVPLPRPILDYEPELVFNQIPTIGSFGFAFGNKGFHRVIDLAKNSFEESNVNIHLSAAFFGDRDGVYADALAADLRAMSEPGRVNVNVSRGFLSNKFLLRFLSLNDVNVFLYDDMPGRGLASTLDYAVASMKPFAVNSTTMFRHVTSLRPDLSVDNNSLENIISMGSEPNMFFKHVWSKENLRAAVEKAILA